MLVKILILLFLGEKIVFDSLELFYLDVWIYLNYLFCIFENKRYIFICYLGYWILLKFIIYIVYFIRLN